MTIPRPTLDDLRYDALVSEAVFALPALSPAWTDHNPSDPGITILEALAHICDGLSWTLSRYERSLTPHFAVLLGEQVDPSESPEVALRRAVLQLDRITRAVSSTDVAAAVRGGLAVLALPLVSEMPAGTRVSIRPVGSELTRLTRAVAAGQRTITTTWPAPRPHDLVVIGGQEPSDPAEVVWVVGSEQTPTRVLIEVDPALRVSHQPAEPVRFVDPSVSETTVDATADTGSTTLQWSPVAVPPQFVVQAGENVIGAAACLPRIGVASAGEVVVMGPGESLPDEMLLQVVYEFLQRRAPAASRLTVRPAEIRNFDIDVAVVRTPSGLQRADALRLAVETALRRHLDPVIGADGHGWPFGFPLYRAALDDVIERVPGVDHVHRLAVGRDDRSDVWPLSDTPAATRRSVARAGDVRVTILDSEDGW